ncbi:MAG TPA: 1-deoxy-D-xylulose-5-phosphate reductoisomerase [Spirochaetia bacterium]|nr:1-deoxy-D-xylulose-5-phosphate reductoisomerase [Spirochaetia bacterium]
MESNEVKRITVLGSTGSIGLSALDVIRHNPGRFEAVALSCHTCTSTLSRQAEDFNPLAVAVTGYPESTFLKDFPVLQNLTLYAGEEGLLRMIEEIPSNIVLNGIAGSSGLTPSVKSIEAGRDLALANKETIVMAGPYILELARSKGVRILPVDSEHSALFNLMGVIKRNSVAEIILTASGGAFRDLTARDLERVNPRDALQHPTWDMGPKITIDSATMANKGLEVIEAMHLFQMDVNRIKVLIHPQSYVHAMVRTVEGSLYAQVSIPDMRIPIQNALSYPEILNSRVAPLDLEGKSLTFLPWESNKYPMLSLAYEAAEGGGSSPIVYNAANEVAVQAFLAERIRFTEISRVVAHALAVNVQCDVTSIEEILDIDRKSRQIAEAYIEDHPI